MNEPKPVNEHGEPLSELEILRSQVQTLEACLRGVQGIIFEDGYEVNVAELRERAEKAEAALSAKRVPTREDVAKALGRGLEQNGALPWEGLDKFNRGTLLDEADAVLALFQPDQMGTE